MQWSKITALVLSIISILFAITVYGFFVPLYLAPLAFIFAIVAIVSTNNHNKINPEEKVSNTMGIISLILSIIAFVIAVFAFFLIGVSSYHDYKVEQAWNDAMDDSSSSTNGILDSSSILQYNSYVISEGESIDVGDITISFDGYSNEGNKYIVDYTIKNNGTLGYMYDKHTDIKIIYGSMWNFDFAEEDGEEIIEAGEEKSFTSTFKVDEGEIVTYISVEQYVEDRVVYFEI